MLQLVRVTLVPRQTIVKIRKVYSVMTPKLEPNSRNDAKENNSPACAEAVDMQSRVVVVEIVQSVVH